MVLPEVDSAVPAEALLAPLPELSDSKFSSPSTTPSRLSPTMLRLFTLRRMFSSG